MSPSFWSAMAFGLFIVGLSKTIKLILKKLDETRKKITQDIEKAALEKKEAEAYLKEAQKEYNQVKEQVSHILKHAQVEADRLREEAYQDIEAMKATQKRLLEERLLSMEKEALQGMKNKAMTMALSAAYHRVKHHHTADKDKAIFAKTLDHIKTMPDFFQK